MPPGPLRRIVAVAGLLALAPTMANVALGTLSPALGAYRAVVTLIVVLVIGNATGVLLRFLADAAERDPDGDGPPHRPDADAKESGR